MGSPAPKLLASERTSADMLDLSVAEFRRLVAIGALPPPVMIGDNERWKVNQLRAIVDGEAARPAEDDIEA